MKNTTKIFVSSIVLSSVLFSNIGFSQLNQISNILNKKPKDDTDERVQILRTDINQLSNENYEGRYIGTKGNKLAAEFIERRMKDVGLTPYYGMSYKIGFKYSSGKELTPEARFLLANQTLKIPNEAFPLTFGADLERNDYIFPNTKEPYGAWLVPLFKSQQEANDPNFDWEQAAHNIALSAVDRNVAGLYIYENFASNHKIQPNKTTRFENLKIPVWMLNNKVYNEQIKNMNSITSIYANAKYRNYYDDAQNVIGHINNNAAKTIVIFANFDGLGIQPEGGNSVVFRSANDNASGIAAMLALAGDLKKSLAKKYNYTFMAYNGKEKSQVGIKSYLMSKGLKDNIAYVINLNIVGKVNQNTKDLYIKGAESNLSIEKAFKSVTHSFKIKQTSDPEITEDIDLFLNQKFPGFVISSGTYPEQGTKNDLPGIINYKGINEIVKLTLDVIEKLNEFPIAAFNEVNFEEQKVRVATTGDNLGVTLDIDYKEGAKIANVIKGSIAQKAGLQPDDVIVKVGSFPTNNIRAYNLAISKFKTGERAYFKVIRGSKTESINIEF